MIAERLSRNRSVCIDTMVFVYFIEEDDRYLPVVRELFEMVDQGDLSAFSSCVTLLEVLVQPLRKQRLDLVQAYKAILLNTGPFRIVPIDQEVAERGAKIRAQYDLPTPDAIQLATALCNGAGAFVTNDTRLRRFNELDVVVLEDFVV